MERTGKSLKRVMTCRISVYYTVIWCDKVTLPEMLWESHVAVPIGPAYCSHCVRTLRLNRLICSDSRYRLAMKSLIGLLDTILISARVHLLMGNDPQSS